MKTLPYGKLHWLPPLLARIAVGTVFAESGWGKIHNIPRVAEFFSSLGIPAPLFQAYAVGYSELIFGLLVFVGLVTRLACLPLIVIMTVAIATAKASELTGLTDIFGFSEFLYILLLIWLVIEGPGKVALDHFVCRIYRR